jgi:ATP-dependent helicase HepA
MNLFDIVGINQDDRGENLIVLTPSDHMLVPDFPGLPEDGCTITFERDVALSREDAQFITWEHPLIRNGLDLILSGDTGSSTISLLKNKALPVGTAAGADLRRRSAGAEAAAAQPLPAGDPGSHAAG